MNATDRRSISATGCGSTARRSSRLCGGVTARPCPRLLGLRAVLPHPVALMLRLSVAFMWLYTALVTALMPQASGVLNLLARCGFEGRAGVAVMVASCTLNSVLGLALLRRPPPWLWPLQIGAVLGYTLTAALNMPELTIDHCGPLVKNVPVLAVLMLLWLAQPAAQVSGGSRHVEPATSRHEREQATRRSALHSAHG